MRAFQRNASIKEEKHLSGTRLNMRQEKEKKETQVKDQGTINQKPGQFRPVVYKPCDFG